MVGPHSTDAKVMRVYSPTEEKGGGDIHKVLGPPLRGGQRRSLGAKVNQRPFTVLSTTFDIVCIFFYFALFAFDMFLLTVPTVFILATTVLLDLPGF